MNEGFVVQLVKGALSNEQVIVEYGGGVIEKVAVEEPEVSSGFASSAAAGGALVSTVERA